ncbi:hypothetical protein Q3G72_019747 [Acer saccharum]|nr:hypothetical protein Q3G72_019747 [Acer saccharum]
MGSRQSSPDALDFLLSNLYSAVHKQVKGLLWDDKFESNSTTENPSAVVEAENPSRIDVTEADTCLQCVDLDLDFDSNSNSNRSKSRRLKSSHRCAAKRWEENQRRWKCE